MTEAERSSESRRARRSAQSRTPAAQRFASVTGPTPDRCRNVARSTKKPDGTEYLRVRAVGLRARVRGLDGKWSEGRDQCLHRGPELGDLRARQTSVVERRAALGLQHLGVVGVPDET